MFDLPDDLWTKILDLGINNNKLTYKDLCSISITCKGLNILSSEDSLWSHLLSNDFPRRSRFSSFFGYDFLDYWYPSFCDSLEEIANQPSSSSAKSQYRIRLERDRERERELEAQRRAFLEQERRRIELFEARRRAFRLEEERLWTELFSQVRFRWAVLEEENDLSDILSAEIQEIEENDLSDILTAKIQEIELAKDKKTRNPTVAELFNSTKANSKTFERVPDRSYPRERRSKAFTQRTKSWHR